MKIEVAYKFELLDDYNDKLIIAKEVTPDTMLIFAMARKNSVSHEVSMDKVPKFITKYFKNDNFMLVYPNQIASEKNEKYSYLG